MADDTFVQPCVLRECGDWHVAGYHAHASSAESHCADRGLGERGLTSGRSRMQTCLQSENTKYNLVGLHHKAVRRVALLHTARLTITSDIYYRWCELSGRFCSQSGLDTVAQWSLVDFRHQVGTAWCYGCYGCYGWRMVRQCCSVLSSLLAHAEAGL